MTKKKKTVLVSFQIGGELLEQSKAWALKNDYSLSGMIRHLLKMSVIGGDKK